MEIIEIAIEDLTLDSDNARRHPDRNLTDIRNSIAKFGQVKPIVIDAHNVVVAGNGTVAAMTALGMPVVKCTRTELTGAAARAFALADNRTSETSEWDFEVVGRHLTEIESELPDMLDATGFDVDERLRVAGMATDGSSHGDTTEPDSQQSAGESGSFSVVVEGLTETQQADLLTELQAQGWTCRALRPENKCP